MNQNRLLVIIIIIFAFKCYSQNKVEYVRGEKIIVNAPTQVSTINPLIKYDGLEFIGREEVRLTPGYKTLEKNQSEFIRKKINVDVILDDESENFYFENRNQSLNKNRSIVNLSGDFSISPSGGSTYNFSIPIPPGTNGMEPKIGLNYNSFRNDNNLGIGWALIAGSKIIRTTKSIHFDGEIESINSGSNEIDPVFLLDGVRILKDDNDFLHPEGAPRTFVKKFGSGENSFFNVDLPNGITHEYKSITVSTEHDIGLIWRITKTRDKLGNYLTYSYSEIDGNTVLTNIKYSGNSKTGLLPYNEIEFLYKTKKHDNTIYYYDAPLLDNKLLYRINIYSEEAMVMSYLLDYSINNIPNPIYQLGQITALNSEGELSLSTQFKYQNNLDEPQEISFSKIAEINSNYRNIDYVTGDFTGDGRDDILGVKFNLASGGFKYYSSYKLFINNTTGFIDGGSGTIPITYFKSVDRLFRSDVYSANPSSGINVGDFNGDGKLDFAISETNLGSDPDKNISTNTHLYISDGSNFIKSSESSEYVVPKESSNNNFLTGDFDGDGATDIIRFGYKHVPQSYYSGKVVLNGNVNTPFNLIGNQNSSEFWEALISYFDYGKPYVIDINGDGKDEVIAQTKNSPDKVFSFEINYDNQTVKPKVLNDGKSWNSSTISAFGNRQLFPGDFNGDGKTDFLATDTNNYQNFIYTNNGLGFDIAPIETPTSNSRTKEIVMDINSDGKSDILLCINSNPNSQNTSSQIIPFYSNGNGFQEGETIEVPYGFVNITDIDYDNFEFNVTKITPSFLFGNFNGNGILNYVFYKLTDSRKYDSGGQVLSYDIVSSQFEYLPNFKIKGLLSSIKDGFGNITNIDYGLINNSNSLYLYNDQFTSSSPFKVLKHGLRVVKNFSVENGIGGRITTNYKYYNAIAHKFGKGFLGFEKIFSFRNSGENSIINYSEQVFNSQFITSESQFTSTSTISDIEDYLLNGTYFIKPTGKIDTYNETKFKKIGDSKMYFTSEKKSHIINRLKNTERFSKNIFDDNTYVLLSSLDSVPGFKTLTEYSEYVEIFSPVNSEYKRKPQRKQVIRSSGNGSDRKELTKYYYNNTFYGRLDSISVYPNGTYPNGTSSYNSITTHFKYDDFGNIISESFNVPRARHYLYNPATGEKTGNLIPDLYQRKLKTTTTVYEPIKGRAPVMVTNTNNDTKSFEYDFKWGRVTESINANGQKISHEYDNWGRLINTISSTGVSTEYSREWCSASFNNIPRAIYKSIITKENREPVSVYYDKIGRKVGSSTINYNKENIFSITTFNNRGKLSEKTNWHVSNSDLTNTSYEYDEYLRLEKESHQNMGTTTFAYNGLTTSVTTPIQTRSTEILPSGFSKNTSNEIDAVNFMSYDDNGFVTQIKTGNKEINLEYDAWGNRIKLDDPDAGVVTHEYNALGELQEQIDPKGNKYFDFKYDDLGRLTSKKFIDKSTSNNIVHQYNYTYDLAPNGKGLISSESLDNSHKTEYSYDSQSRLSSTTETVEGNNYINDFEYNEHNQITYRKYPSGLELEWVYNEFGHLIEIIDLSNNKSIWNMVLKNDQGNIKQVVKGNGLITNYDYDIDGLLQSSITKNISEWHYDWDKPKMQLKSRENRKYGLLESFDYDLDRLTLIKDQNENIKQSIEYENSENSRIKNNSDVGDYIYSHEENISSVFPNNAIKGLQNIKNENGLLSKPNQVIKYNGFNSVSSIVEGDYKLEIEYGHHNQRIFSTLTDNNSQTIIKKVFLGDVEIISEQILGVVVNKKTVHYISAPDGLLGIYVINDSGLGQMYYTYSDHLGTITEVTDEEGNIVFEQSYNAWGRKRNPLNWEDLSSQSNSTNFSWLRGYTMHENLDEFELINMNGRFYDPQLCMMLSPDNYVQGGGSSINYNRFTYALNNPLKYTDPDGEWVQVAIGAGIGVITNGLSNISNERPFFEGAGEAAIIGGISGGISFGIGEAVSGMTGFGKVATQAIAHAHLGGTMSSYNGGTYWQGAASGAVGSTIGVGSSSIFENSNPYIQAIGITLSGGVTGGLSSEISGGDFWDGFRNGAISAGLNHGYHLIESGVLMNQLKKVYENYPTDGNEEISVEEAFKRVSPAALKSHKDGIYNNACATRLSLAFVKAGIKLPNGYGGLIDSNGNRIIISAYQMQKFMSNKYGSLMTKYNPNSSRKGIYIGVTKPGLHYSGHVTIIRPGFNSNTYSSSMRSMYFWSIE